MPTVAACPACTRETDNPLQMDTANASIDSPTAIKNNSHTCIVHSSVFDSRMRGATKKDPPAPRQISLIISNSARLIASQCVDAATPPTGRQLLPYHGPYHITEFALLSTKPAYVSRSKPLRMQKSTEIQAFARRSQAGRAAKAARPSFHLIIRLRKRRKVRCCVGWMSDKSK